MTSKRIAYFFIAFTVFLIFFALSFSDWINYKTELCKTSNFAYGNYFTIIDYKVGKGCQFGYANPEKLGLGLVTIKNADSFQKIVIYVAYQETMNSSEDYVKLYCGDGYYDFSNNEYAKVYNNMDYGITLLNDGQESIDIGNYSWYKIVEVKNCDDVVIE
jgi:hypothetical protein